MHSKTAEPHRNDRAQVAPFPHCTSDFDIGIVDTRHRSNNAQPRVERFIVAKEG